MKSGTETGKTSKKLSLSTAVRHFEEAKTVAKLRKRKERQESVGALTQDRKVIRSNSEERPAYPAQDGGMRRVSSSGDFPQNGEPLKKSEPSRYEDYDRTRSFERFARPHNSRQPKKYPTPKRYKARPSKTKPKCDSDGLSKRNNNLTEEKISSEPDGTTLRFLDLSPVQDERSPSPTRPCASPIPAFATLYERADNQEPIVSQPVSRVTDDMETMPGQLIASNKMASSPRNSIIATRRIYLDPNVPQPQASISKLPTNPIDERIEKLARLINGCKRKIVACETEFETRTGTKPDQSQRLNDPSMRKLYAELGKLKREQRHLAEISVSTFEAGQRRSAAASLEETVKEIETRLKLSRDAASRDVDRMTETELVDEKIATQKALLFLESVHGRPQTKQDRDLVRPFYDRYRLLKQTILKTSSAVNGGELATIDENETMHFVTSTSSSNETDVSDKTATAPSKPKETALLDNVQTLSKAELLEQLRIIKDEKRTLRVRIKEFEKAVQDNLGRMLTKEDKKPAEELYVSYKRVKGRLRLIEVLLGKC